MYRYMQCDKLGIETVNLTGVVLTWNGLVYILSYFHSVLYVSDTERKNVKNDCKRVQFIYKINLQGCFSNILYG